MIRIFVTKAFDRFAVRERLEAAALRQAVESAEAGRIDADLGGGIIKLRMARKGQGKSAGYRAILVFRAHRLAVFVYGFAKNDRDNIRADELRAFRRLAGEILALDPAALARAVESGALREITTNG